MSREEVFKEITSEHKWYFNYCSSSYATQIKQKFASGNLGEKAIERLFTHFGYEVKTPEQWERKRQS